MRQLSFLMQRKKKFLKKFFSRPAQPPQRRKRVAVFRRAWYPFCVRTGQREARYERYSGRQKGDAARRARLDESAGVRLHRADRLDGRKRLLLHLHSKKYHAGRLGDLRDRLAASAIAAALATIFSAAWSDRVGKRRAFVCWGYILWGITTAAFALFGNGQVGGSVGLAVTLFVVMDASCPPSAARPTTRPFPPGSRT